MCEFSYSNQILLNLSDVSNVFHDNLLVNIETKICQTMLTIQLLYGKLFETLNKFNKIWLKGINLNIYKIRGLYWTKVSKEKLNWTKLGCFLLKEIKILVIKLRV